MNSKDTTLMKKARSTAAVAVLVAVSLVGISFPSYGQGLSAGQAGLLDTSRGLSPDHESLLPPAVVPFDPAAANKHAQGQEINLEINNGTGSMPAPAQANPQHMNMHPASSGYSSPQDQRQALFNSLMQKGNGNSAFTSQFSNSNYGQMQAGGYNQPFQPLQAQNAYQPLAQPDWLAPQAQSVPSVMSSVGQTQTLTAAPRNPVVRRDTRRGGLANNLAGGLSLGSGLFSSGLKRPNSLMGLGTTALFMTGFGRR